VCCEAARILQSADQTVDPCSDFFEFACGQWNREHPIPDEQAKYDVFSMLTDGLQDRLKSESYTSATFGGGTVSASVCLFVRRMSQKAVFGFS